MGSAEAVSGAGLASLDGSQQLLSLLADHDEHGPDGSDLTLLDEDLEHRAAPRRRDLDRRLVGLHLDERLVLLDALPLRDEPACDLGFRETLAEVGELELVRHGGAGYCDPPRRAYARAVASAGSRTPRTSYAAIGRGKPLSVSSPTGTASTSSSTSA